MSNRYQSKRGPLIKYVGNFERGKARNKLEMQLKKMSTWEKGCQNVGENADVFYGWSQMKIHCNIGMGIDY